jgi:DNA (cytosine-5)-methyltransferase 1
VNELALFAGAGGGVLGGKLLGWRTICAVEINPFCRSILLSRQKDGILEPFPIWDDVKTFDGKPWNGYVDIISGGFPCQDISVANDQSNGLDGERSGLWKEMSRIINDVRPRFVLVENSPALTFRGLGTILGELATMGYDAKWGVFSAADAGARHQRERIWIVAYSNSIRFLQPARYSPKQYTNFLGEDFRFRNGKEWKFVGDCERGKQDNTESVLLRKSDAMANQMDRLASIGNGQVPAVVRLAWETLTGLY